MEKYFNGNKNIAFFEISGQKGYDFQPYDREITVPYVVRNLKKMVETLPDDCAISTDGHSIVFDGLAETNIGLIKDGCWVECIYTHKSKEFKPRRKGAK